MPLTDDQVRKALGIPQNKPVTERHRKRAEKLYSGTRRAERRWRNRQDKKGH
jgi:hypothetical protein